MNVADSQRVASALEKLGYLPTPRADDADVIVLNTCVVRQSAEDKAYGRLNSLRPLKQHRPEVVINLMGCLVGVRGNPKLQEAFPHVDVFSPPSDPEPLLEYLARIDGHAIDQAELRERHALMDHELRLPLQERGNLVAAHVPVVYGCSHACTFCIIPYRRGAERSRPVGEIAAEVRGLARQGVREVTLLGQIVDRYDKSMLTGGDEEQYTPGDHLVTLTLKGIKCGLLICYDNCFPEMYNAYRHRGVELMFHSFYNARFDGPNILDEFTPAQIICRAADNVMWVAANNSSARHSCWTARFVRPDGSVASQLKRHVAGILTQDFPDATLKGWIHNNKMMVLAPDEVYHNGTPSAHPRALDRTAQP